jgi:hypothetical protein
LSRDRYGRNNAWMIGQSRSRAIPFTIVMLVLDTSIHVSAAPNVDGRVEPGHDEQN